MNSTLTPRDIAAMTAQAAGIKAENDAYTQGRLRAGRMVRGMRVDGSSLLNERGEMIAMAFTSDVDGEADARRLAACWNVCEGIPTETLESCAHWSDIVSAPLNHRQHIPAEAAAVGAALDGESLEQGEPS